MLIGAYGISVQPGRFKGVIDEVRIWKDARTGEEIQSHMSGVLTGEESALVAYYSFDHSKGRVLGDYSQTGPYRHTAIFPIPIRTCTPSSPTAAFSRTTPLSAFRASTPKTSRRPSNTKS